MAIPGKGAVGKAIFEKKDNDSRLVSVMLIVNVLAIWRPESKPDGLLPFAAR